MERLTLQEYKERYGDNPIAEKDHGSEVILWNTDEDIPFGEYYGTIEERAELDADSILYEFEYEYDLENCDGAEELKEFIKEWNRKYGVNLWFVNEECEVIV